jgi:CRISPR-associated exonuclease Cas4
MEQGNENVAIGKLIDEESYRRDEKHINIDNVINIDFIKSKGVLHEIKKSRKIEEASILQVKYYLYYLMQRGVEIKAQIDYPLIKQTVQIELKEVDIETFEKIIINIHEIVAIEVPPCIPKKAFCKSCAYFDLCYV